MRSSKSILLIALMAVSAVTAMEIFTKQAFLQEVTDAQEVPAEQLLDLNYKCLYVVDNDVFDLTPLSLRYVIFLVIY